MVCDTASYDGTMTSTAADLTLTPIPNNCHTTGSSTNIPFHMHECKYTMTVAPKTTDSTEQTIDLVCPSEKAIEITHPNCTVTVPPQNNFLGITYTTQVENGKHTITVDLATEFNVTFHGGICIFTGTNHTGTLDGALTMKGFQTGGKQVGITAT